MSRASMSSWSFVAVCCSIGGSAWKSTSFTLRSVSVSRAASLFPAFSWLLKLSRSFLAPAMSAIVASAGAAQGDSPTAWHFGEVARTRGKSTCVAWFSAHEQVRELHPEKLLRSLHPFSTTGCAELSACTVCDIHKADSSRE